jgi:antitoxin component YwqK of YwqJK toxin-antitoxin module
LISCLPENGVLPSGLKIVMTLENYKNGKLEGLRSVYYQAEKSQKKLVI